MLQFHCIGDSAKLPGMEVLLNAVSVEEKIARHSRDGTVATRFSFLSSTYLLLTFPYAYSAFFHTPLPRPLHQKPQFFGVAFFLHFSIFFLEVKKILNTETFQVYLTYASRN
ncbi:hypothetical protein Dimus_000369 [Dionaea muscipula]